MAKKKKKPATETKSPPPKAQDRLPVFDLKDDALEPTGEHAKPVRLN